MSDQEINNLIETITQQVIGDADELTELQAKEIVFRVAQILTEEQPHD